MRTTCIVLAAGLALTAFAADPPAPNPKEPVDYVKWLNDGFSKGVKDNAAPLYMEVADALKDKDVLDGLPKQLTGGAPWSEAERKAVEERVKANKALLDKFCAASKKADCYFELKNETPRDGIMGVMVRELKPLRDIARLLAARAWLEFSDGQTDAALSDVACLFATTQHLQWQPLLIQYLVGRAIENLACDTLLNAAYAHPDACQKMLDGLKDARLRPRTVVRQIAMEKLQALDAVQRWLTDKDGDGKYETMTLPSFLDSRAPIPQPSEPHTVAELAAEIEEHYKRLSEIAAADYPKGRELLGSLAKEHPAKGEGGVLGSVGWDVVDRPYEIYNQELATTRAVWIVLRLQAHHARTGKWPSELKEVLYADPPETAFDPFSMKPFVYRLDGDKPLLYSVSLNGVDDHGEVFRKDGKAAWGETGDRVFLPKPE